MTPKQRTEARRLVDAATPGPWRWAQLVDGIEARAIIDARGYHFARVDDIENGVFIAASRTLVPQLLDALEAAERERDEARAKLVHLPDGTTGTDWMQWHDDRRVERDEARAALSRIKLIAADFEDERDTARARLAEVERKRDEALDLVFQYENALKAMERERDVAVADLTSTILEHEKILANARKRTREAEAERDTARAQVATLAEAVRDWWAGHRPVEWKEATHLDHPTVNTCTEREARLARVYVEIRATLKAAGVETLGTKKPQP